MDNVFAFALNFTSFAVPDRYQHKVVFGGDRGAAVPAALRRRRRRAAGALLLDGLPARRLLYRYTNNFPHDTELQPERNLVVRLVGRLVPADPRYHGDRLFTRIDGKRVAILLFVALVAVGAHRHSSMRSTRWLPCWRPPAAAHRVDRQCLRGAGPGQTVRFLSGLLRRVTHRITDRPCCRPPSPTMQNRETTPARE